MRPDQFSGLDGDTMFEAVILAAGKGTRMRSSLPKVMHTLAGKPLLQHVLDTTRKLHMTKIHLVLGHGAELIQSQMQADDIHFVLQQSQLGTGHAVLQAAPDLDDQATCLILYGDVPLISAATLTKLLAAVDDNTMALLTVKLPNPTGYGRILRAADDSVEGIVEQKDASPEQLLISEVNTGVVAVKSCDLKAWLPQIDNNNAQQEYYLTDLVKLAVANGKTVQTIATDNHAEVMGINNRAQQAELERLYQRQQAQALMEQGVSLLDPSRFDLRGELSCGEDCVIDINCLFEGQVTLGKGVTIEPNCIIKNARILDGTVIHANTIVDDALIGKDCVVGPFARIRPGSQFAQGAKIGNFVETKKAIVGRGSKINHLSYVGDAELGEDVNIGAGTITCNYDGVNKYQTIIQDHVFIGSNTALVAPVTVETDATVAAGSVITQNVKAKQLAVARQRQKNIDGWTRPTKKK